jgi:hypothetical protein
VEKGQNMASKIEPCALWETLFHGKYRSLNKLSWSQQSSRYSNKSRGQRAERTPAAPGSATARSPTAQEARKGWAALIRHVYEVDPLCCSKCGSTMRIISFIAGRQTELLEKILRSRRRGTVCGRRVRLGHRRLPGSPFQRPSAAHPP